MIVVWPKAQFRPSVMEDFVQRYARDFSVRTMSDAPLRKCSDN
jgi:hypothetical protein